MENHNGRITTEKLRNLNREIGYDYLKTTRKIQPYYLQTLFDILDDMVKVRGEDDLRSTPEKVVQIDW